MKKQIVDLPVAKNDQITLCIEDLGSKGEGIGHFKGYTVFVEGALPGEQVLVQMVQVRRSFGYGKLLQVISASPDRVVPECPLAGKCGGCQLAHLSYEGQLRYKRDKVRQVLERIGHFAPEEVAEVLAPATLGMADGAWQHYRNKAQFPVQMAGSAKAGDAKVEAGFFAPRSHRLLPVYDCRIQSQTANELISKITDFMRAQNVSIYDEERHEGLVRHVLIRNGRSAAQVSVCLVINGKRLAQQAAWVSFMQEQGVSSFSVNINQEKSNVILGRETRVLYGAPYIEDQISNLKFHISPASFYQVNPAQTQVLYEQALAMAGLTGSETVWDAYCGIGTISLFLAPQAQKVYGVEIVPAAIADAKENARLNGIQNAEFFVGQAEEVIPRLYHEQGIRADVMVVDPPRAGCEASLLHTFLDMAPERIVYVSCDPATLSRDLDILCHQGQYQLTKVQPVDMFPMTGHVETVVLMSRVESKM